MVIFEYENIFVVEISFYFKSGRGTYRADIGKHVKYHYLIEKINPISYILPKNDLMYISTVTKKYTSSYFLNYNRIYKRLSNIITNHFVSHVKELTFNPGNEHSVTVIDIINKVYVDLNVFKKYLETINFIVVKEYQTGGSIGNHNIYKINKANYLVLCQY